MDTELSLIDTNSMKGRTNSSPYITVLKSIATVVFGTVFAIKRRNTVRTHHTFIRQIAHSRNYFMTTGFEDKLH